MSIFDVNQTEIFKELKRDITIEVFYQNIKKTFKDNRTKLADYIIFIFRNNILQREERFIFEIVLIKLSQEFNLKNHLRLILQIVMKIEENVDLLLLHDLVVLKNMQKYKNRKITKLDSFVNSLREENQNTKLIKTAVIEEIEQLDNSGPELEAETFILSCQLEEKRVFLDNFISKEEFVRRSCNFDSIRKGTRFCPEFLVPEPEEIPLDNEELFVPFPFIVQAPLINPCIRKEAVVIELLNKTGKLNKNEFKVLIEIIGLYPDSLTKKYFFENLQRLVNQDSDLVARIGIILAEKRQPLFKDFLLEMKNNIDLNLRSLEIIYKLLNAIKIDQDFINAYIKKWIDHCDNLEEKNESNKLVLICKFFTELIKRKLFDPSKNMEIWIHFCLQNNTHKCVKEMDKLLRVTLKENENN
jgi:hypothetical protein